MNKWVVRGKADAMNILVEPKSKKRNGEAKANSKTSRRNVSQPKSETATKKMVTQQ